MASPFSLLVSGAAGFLGRRVRRAALDAGYQVTAVIRACEREFARELADGPVVELDWNDDAALAELLRTVSPRTIVHCAGHSGRFAGAPDVPELRDANVGLSSRLLEGVSRACPEARVVLLSSAAVYGVNPPIPTREDAPLLPVSDYGASKLLTESVAGAYAAQGVCTIIARPFNVIGPGEPPGSVVSRLAAQALAVSPGDTARVSLREAASVRDFVDVDDVAQALVVLSSRGAAGAAYNVCSGRGVSIGELVDRASRVWQRRIELGVEDAAAVATVSVGDPSALAALGWRPQRSLEESLAAIAADVAQVVAR
jgi:GDP-4-dehydro-6-deoxy-D-mannose reductase